MAASGRLRRQKVPEIDSAPSTVRRRLPIRGRRTARNYSRRTIGCILALAVVTTAIAWIGRPQAAVAEPESPGAAWSHHVKSTSPRASNRLGCQEGIRMTRFQSLRDTIAILDFGRPVGRRRHHRGPWHFGTSLFRKKGFVPIRSILAASEAYARGVWRCTRGLRGAHIRIALGTSNWGDGVTWTHGRAWAGMVNRANAWVTERHTSSKIDFAGANDIELSWNGPRTTRNWVRGYESLANYPYYDYGAADACPPRGRCAGAWTMEDLWYVSWGALHAWPIPEIYTPDRMNARQWYNLAVYSYQRHGSAMRIVGVMSQHGACRRAKDPCRGMNNTPERAWRQLYQLLNGDRRTRQLILWATDIR
jgi:hypothetical protein